MSRYSIEDCQIVCFGQNLIVRPAAKEMNRPEVCVSKKFNQAVCNKQR